MEYTVTLHISTAATLDEVYRHFADMCRAVHEINLKDGDYKPYNVEAVGVKQE